MLTTSHLLDAAADTLEHEAHEVDWARRTALLARTRATLSHWRIGLLSTEQAVAELEAARSPVS
ncbi:MAG: hypothetical protein ACRELB_15775 [Polyangiaceae bacterium]